MSVLASIADVLQPLIDFFESILLFFHDTLGFAWGWAIVALTICVRAALMPLTIKQFKSMQHMVQIAPEIKKLQEKYKNDRERLQQETMRLYRENKVNPFASCLPMVAQLPVFLSLFYMLRTDLRIDICPEVNPPGTPHPVPCGPGGDASFLFIPDLTNNATGWVLLVLIVLYVGSQLLSTVLMSTATDRTQRMIFLALPFFFVIFVINFPAGLLVYWITTNLWTIVQQTVVRKRLGPMRPISADGEAPPMSIMDRWLHGSNPPQPAPIKNSAVDGNSAGDEAKPRAKPAAPPPPSPRKKKKRSGRRR